MSSICIRDESPSILKYCGIFAVAYGGLLGLNLLLVDTGTEIKGASAIIALAATYASAASFVRYTGRSPNTSERRRLAWWSLVASIAVSIAFAFIALGPDTLGLMTALIQRVTPILFGVAFIIVSMIYYLLLGLCYLIFGNLALKFQSHSR